MGDPVYTFVLPAGVVTDGPDSESLLTELRIHGVSGPDPAGVLESSSVFHVAGDKITGFARRLDGNGYGATDVVSPKWPNRRLEAFSWRGVSSGAASRALWLLLMPFAFLNVAAWMHPIAALDPSLKRDERVPRQDPWNDPYVVVLHWLLRALGLVYTLLLMLSTLAATVDVPYRAGVACHGSTSGWRCWVAGQGSWTRGGGLAASSLVLGVLVYLARSTWKRFDGQKRPLEHDSVRTPLGNRNIWGTKQSVAKQRTVHLLAGAALILWFGLQPELSQAAGIAALVIGVVVLAGLLALSSFSMADDLERPEDISTPPTPLPDGAEGSSSPTDVLRPLTGWSTTARRRWATGTAVAVLVALALMVVLVHHRASTATTTDPTRVDHFHLRLALGTLLTALFLLTLAVFVVVHLLRRRAPRNPNHRPMLDNWTTALMCLMAFLAAAVLSDAIVLAAAKLFTPKGTAILTPGFAELATLGEWVIPGTVSAAVLYMAVFWVICKRRFLPDIVLHRVPTPPPAAVAEVEVEATVGSTEAQPKYLPDQKAYRNACATAHLSRSAYRVVPVLTAGALTWMVATAAMLLHHVTPTSIPDMGRVVTTVLAALPTALVAVGSKIGDRRKAGVIWDVVTFWPRAAHPLAPPCYAERVIPQLVDRIAALEKTGPVLVSGHSQGAMISSALFQQLSKKQVENTALVTYGCQLSFLFARAFPSYCGGYAMAELGAHLRLTEFNGTTDQNVPPPTPRWINLFRYTDLLGGRVYLPQGCGEINREVADPRYALYRLSNNKVPPLSDGTYCLQNKSWSQVGDLITDTAPQGHSNYPAAYEYRAAAYALDVVLGHGTP